MDASEVRTQQEDVLKAFVLRARRVGAHSLAEDRKSLGRLQNPQYNVTVNRVTGSSTIRREFPPEEQVESAAARVRPLLLEGEDAHYAKALNALMFFAREDGADATVFKLLKGLRQEWVDTASEKAHRLTYEVRLKQGEGPEQAIDDRRLAFAWIYGDVVHADPDRREAAHFFGVEERFHAAVPLIAQLMVLTIRTLHTIEWLHGCRLLPFLHDAFAEDVVVTRQVVEVEGQVWTADYVDGKLPHMPPIGDDFGPDWIPIAEGTLQTNSAQNEANWTASRVPKPGDDT